MRHLWAVIAGSLLSAACVEADNDYKLEQVTDGQFYHQGVHEDASRENFGAIANVGFIIGSECVAVIDSGGSYLEGKKLLNALRQQTDKPVCYVINTHVHPDHVLGNAAFKEENPQFVGHEKLPEAINARGSHYAEQFSEILGEAYDGSEFISPDITVKRGSPMQLDLGDRQLTLSAYSTAHTDHDLTVFDSQTRTLWTGDLLFVDRTPALDGSINGWIDVINDLQSMEVDYVIPGHGGASQGNASPQWRALQTYLTKVRDQIRVIIEDFGTIPEATRTVGTELADDWLLFDEYHRRNVTAAFKELEWE